MTAAKGDICEREESNVPFFQHGKAHHANPYCKEKVSQTIYRTLSAVISGAMPSHQFDLHLTGRFELLHLAVR